MPFFHAAPNGAQIVLDEDETRVLRQLTGEFRALIAGKRTDRGDPVYDRLFPSAYETTEDEIKYRDLIGDDLEAYKLQALDTVSTALADGGTDVTLTDEDFEAWLSCLTDLRLAIGVRLDVDEERMGAEIDPHDPDAHALAILHWLGWLQEGLIEARHAG